MSPFVLVKNGSPPMDSPLTGTIPANGAKPCLTQTTTIRAITDIKPIYHDCQQGAWIAQPSDHKGLCLVLLVLAGMTIALTGIAAYLGARLFYEN